MYRACCVYRFFELSLKWNPKPPLDPKSVFPCIHGFPTFVVFLLPLVFGQVWHLLWHPRGDLLLNWFPLEPLDNIRQHLLPHSTGSTQFVRQYTTDARSARSHGAQPHLAYHTKQRKFDWALVVKAGIVVICLTNAGVQVGFCRGSICKIGKQKYYDWQCTRDV